MNKTSFTLLTLTTAMGLLLSGCHGGSHTWYGTKSDTSATMDGSAAAMAVDGHDHQAATSETTGSVTVSIMNAQGQKTGTAILTQQKDGVRVQVEATGLTPGKHGLHVHDIGKCVVPDFKSAGDHFNPDMKKHGFDNPQGYHNGDLPNLVVGQDGVGKADYVDSHATLEKGKPNSLLKAGGTALVIHEKEDDYKTDPSGNSGGRIACGVIQ